MPRSEVRPLAFGDMGALLHLALLFHQESWQRVYDFDPVKIETLMEQALIGPRIKCFLLVCEGRPVGYIAGVAAEMYFGRDKNVTDLGLYIRPEHRNIRNARALVDALEAWAWSIPGVREISLGVSAGIAQDGIVRFYQRLGYTQGFHGLTKRSR